jgi:hypothetical protein
MEQAPFLFLVCRAIELSGPRLRVLKNRFASFGHFEKSKNKDQIFPTDEISNNISFHL